MVKNAGYLFFLGLLIGTGFLACGIVELVSARRYARIQDLPIMDERKPQLKGSSLTKNILGGIFICLAVGVYLPTAYIPIYWYRLKRSGNHIEFNIRNFRVISDIRFIDRRRNTGQQPAEAVDEAVNEAVNEESV